MKEFPRIHSLGTINIIHHQEFFYEFHPFRTDFVGESGVGKSIITDLLQLILVGSTHYSSSTQGTDDRPISGLVLKNQDSSDFAYAYINVELEPKQFLIIGTYLQANSEQSTSFIIQNSLDFEDANLRLDSLQKPILIDQFEKEGKWLPINDLDLYFNSEQGFGFKKFSRFQDYHRFLVANHLVPFDITPVNSLKDYAKILQAFSRKGISFNDGVDLQYFLFGKTLGSRYYDEFNEVVKSMDESITTFRKNSSEIRNIVEKDMDLKKLKELEEEKNSLNFSYKSKNYHFLKKGINGIQKELEKRVSIYFFKREKLAALNTLQRTKISQLTQEIELAEKQKTEVEDKYNLLKSKVGIIESIKTFMQQRSFETTNELIDFYTTFHQNKELYIVLTEGNKVINKYGLLEPFAALNHTKGLSSIINSLTQEKASLNQTLETQEALYAFSDIANKKSLPFWVTENHAKLSHEQESIIHYFQETQVGIEPPNILKKGDKYIPNPEKILNLKITVEDSKEGFWADFGGVNTYLKYVPQLFDGRPIEDILEKFKENREKLKVEIELNQDSIFEKDQLLSAFNEISNAEQFLVAWQKKDELTYTENDGNETLLSESFDQLKKKIAHYKKKTEILEEFEQVEKEKNGIQSVWSSKVELKKNLINHELHTLSNNNELLEGLADKLIVEITPTIKLEYKEDEFYAKFLKDHIDNVNYDEIPEKVTEFQTQLDTIQKEIDAIELEFERGHLEKAKKEGLDSEDMEALKKKSESKKATFSEEFTALVRKWIKGDTSNLEKEKNFKIAVKSLLPDIFKQFNIEDTDVFAEIATYLEDINQKNAEIKRNKMFAIKNLLQDLNAEVNRQTNRIRRINNTFNSKEAEITGGLKASLKPINDLRISVSWLQKCTSEIQVVNEGLFDPLTSAVSDAESSNQQSIEEYIISEYKRCSESPLPSVTLKQLLSPYSYYDLNYKIITAKGQKNSGSTGQTYSALALLCIAKLSLIQSEEGSSNEGIRFMSIDEAAGIGSNFEMLTNIARKYHYQILSLSIKLNRVDEGNQHIYKLFRNKEEDWVNTHPVPIFGNNN